MKGCSRTLQKVAWVMKKDLAAIGPFEAGYGDKKSAKSNPLGRFGSFV
jgi:hypothetical protein